MDTATYTYVGQIILAAIPVFSPLLVAFVKKVTDSIPKQYYPVLAVVFGTGLDLLNSYATGVGACTWYGPVLGLAGVGVREIYDQFVHPKPAV